MKSSASVHCTDCIIIPDAFPSQCAMHLYEDGKLLFAGQPVADMQCTYMCALTVAAWAGQFVPTNGLDKQPLQTRSDEENLSALKSAIDANGEGKTKGARVGADAFDWKAILKLVMDVLIKLFI